MKRMNVRLGLGMLLVVGCSQSDATRIDVAGHNELGVVALETNHFEDHGASVFELRGLDQSDNEVGLVRLTTGVIDDLLKSGDGTGSEIIVSVAGNESRIVSRETRRHTLIAPDPAVPFLELGEVSSILETQADVFVRLHPTADAREAAFMAATCSASMVNVTPIAQQCCSTTEVDTGDKYVQFIRPSDGSMVYKEGNPNGLTPCRGDNGTSLCIGESCYYGPNGFARPYTYKGGNYGRVERVGGGALTTCTVNWYSSPQTAVFPNVTGTFPNGQNCPGGALHSTQWDE